MKIDFEFDTKHGKYRDALYFPDDAVPDAATIEAMKAERVNNWIYAVDNPPAPEPEYVEIDGIKYEKVEIDGQVVLKPVTEE
jgi:hypothetical protein